MPNLIGQIQLVAGGLVNTSPPKWSVVGVDKNTLVVRGEQMTCLASLAWRFLLGFDESRIVAFGTGNTPIASLNRGLTIFSKPP
jgi:hypothetical protein